MATRKLLAAILILSMVTFFAVPMTAFAKVVAPDPSATTAIHLHDMLPNDAKTISDTVPPVLIFDNSTTPEALFVKGGGNLWDATVLSSLLMQFKAIKVTYADDSFDLFSWVNEADFGPRSGDDYIQYDGGSVSTLSELEKNGEINLFLENCKTITPPPPVTFTVEYFAPGSTGGTIPTDPALYEENDPVTVKTAEPTKTDFNFAGWKIGNAGSILGSTFSMPGNDVELYAQWTPASTTPATFTVEYFAPGSTGGTIPTDPALYEENDPVTVKTAEPTMTDFNFAGWKINDTGSVLGLTFSMPGNNVELYAQWTPVTSANIAFTKTVSPNNVNSRNATVTYTFEVRNSGDYTLRNVIISDSTIGMESFMIETLGVGETTTRAIDVDLGDLVPGAWSSFTNTATVTAEYGDGGSINPVDATATVTYSPNNRPTPKPTPTPIEIVTPEIPAGPVILPSVVPVLDEPVPAAPLPKTGGLDPSFLYGLGLLLAGGGVAIKRRKK